MTVAYKSGSEWAIACILHGTKFRKLRTEREKFIDAVKRFRNVDHVIDADAYFGGLYDAGFRAPDNK